MNRIEQKLYNRYVLSGNNKWLWLYHVITFGPLIGWSASGAIAVITESVKEWFILTLILMLVVTLGLLVHLTSIIINDKRKEWEREARVED